MLAYLDSVGTVQGVGFLDKVVEGTGGEGHTVVVGMAPVLDK